jgi:hypothetical protein
VQESATESEGEGPLFDKAASFQGWDEFYRWVNRFHGAPELLARLILRRLAGEVGLSATQVRSVLRTLQEERVAAEDAVIRVCSGAKLKSIFDCPDEQQRTYRGEWNALGEILARVHRQSDAALEAGFTPEQRAAINHHLRNDNLALCHEYKRDDFGTNLGGDRYWVVGIGTMPFSRAYSGAGDETDSEALGLPAVLR